MADDLNPVVVDREPCPKARPDQASGRTCAGWRHVCHGCLRDGTRAVLDSAREVERVSTDGAEPPRVWEEAS